MAGALGLVFLHRVMTALLSRARFAVVFPLRDRDLSSRNVESLGWWFAFPVFLVVDCLCIWMTDRMQGNATLSGSVGMVRMALCSMRPWLSSMGMDKRGAQAPFCRHPDSCRNFYIQSLDKPCTSVSRAAVQ